MRILRGNLLASVKSECTIAELYPGAIGHPADLSRKVVIRHVSHCRAAGLSTGSAKSELIDYKPQEIPVLGADRPCNILTGDHVLTNVQKAPVGDAISFHPKEEGTEALWELLQPKSSDYTRNGMPIDPTSRAVLLTTTIKNELKKIKSSSVFFQGHKSLLVVISNKPLARSTSNSMYLCCLYIIANIKYLQISLSQTSMKPRLI